MPDYADTSFLVSSYFDDANTPVARNYLAQTGVVFVLTRFHFLEISNAFQLALFRKLTTPAAIQVAHALLEDDLRNSRLIKTGISYARAFRLAAELSERYAATMGIRSLDLLHVASAQMLNATTFATFDARQRELAKLVGLRVVP